MIPALVLTALLSNFPGVEVSRVIDGDTFIVNLPGEPEVFGRELPVRLSGINTAEIRDKRACAKRDAEAAKKLLEKLVMGQKVKLFDCGRDKFFRLLCSAEVQPGADVSETMIALQKAVPYYGDTKEVWNCEAFRNLRR
jgi:micrococcal nuclease